MRSTLARLGMGAALALVLLAVDGSIVAKERIRRDGTLVYLELAPVDPRSLMQGDYMALRFVLARELEAGLQRGKGGSAASGSAELLGEGGFALAPLQLDERGVASLAPAGRSTVRFRWRLRGGKAWLGTNAFFFQEGDGARYQPARYGEFRLDRDSGEAILVGLRDQALQPL